MSTFVVVIFALVVMGRVVVGGSGVLTIAAIVFSHTPLVLSVSSSPDTITTTIILILVYMPMTQTHSG